MKRYYFLISLIYTVCSLFAFDYYTYSKIDSALHKWQGDFGTSSHPDNIYSGFGIIYNLDTIGYSTQDSLPIYAVKLSANANIREAEPKVLILGQCHAEEIYGVEIAMEIIKQFLYPEQNKKQFLQEGLFGSEIWIVPTHNPEGLRVVHGWNRNGEYLLDHTFRKSIRDVTNYGIVDYQVGIGHDHDGVDLNRNYDFNWSFGDTLLQPCSGSGCTTYPDDFDYYRGESPESELEVQAIVNLAREQNFLLSIAYHSSRSGRIDRYIIYPWAWKDKCKCDVTELKEHSPGFNLIESLGAELASIVTSYQNQDYQHTGSSYRKGNAQDWFYSETGCIQYLIEAGHSDTDDNIYGEGLLVEEEYINDVVDSNLDGFFHVLMRAVGSNYNGVIANQIRGQVLDGNSVPIARAVISIPELENDLTKPRLTDEAGFYARLLHPDEVYTVSVSAFGYKTITSSIDHSSAKATNRDFILSPSPSYNVKVSISTPDSANSNFSLIRKHVLQADTFLISSNEVFVWPEGDYEITLISSSYMTSKVDLELIGDDALNFNLLYKDVSFKKEYSGENSQNWYGGFDSNSLIIPLDYLNSGDSIVIEILFKYELEHGYDYLSLHYITNTDTVKLKKYTGNSLGFYVEHIPFIIPVNHSDGELLFEIDKDDSINYQGVQIDYVKILKGSSSPLDIDQKLPTIPYKYSLSQNFPNPFNPSTSISFSVPNRSQVIISIYDIRGNFIEKIADGVYVSGKHTINFDAARYSTGIYLYRLKTEGASLTKKFMVIK